MEKFNNYFSLLLVLLFLIHQTYGQNDLTPPEIFPQGEEYVINATQTFTLSCSGKTFVTWTPPNNTEFYCVDCIKDESYPKYSKIAIESSKTLNSTYPYESVLTITNASYLDVGYYYCHENNTNDFKDLSNVSKIYLYVYDTEKLTLISDTTYGVTVIEHSEVVLPCRPTTPDVRVKITHSTGEEIPLNVKDEFGSIVTYDPKTGYTISKATKDVFVSIYFCKFFRGSYEEEIFLPLNVVPDFTNFINKPILEEISDGHTVIGQKLMLKCTLRNEKQLFTMNWNVPDKYGIQSGRINISKAIKTPNENEFFQNLVIENTTIADEGEYTCIVRSIQDYVNNDTKYVKVYNFVEHFINLTEENRVYNVWITVGESSPAQWRINVNAHPTPKLIWYDNNDEEIQTGWTSNDNSKYEIKIESGKYTLLKINNVTIFDRGYYKLKAMNSFEEKTLKVFLNVTSKPNVDLKIKNFYYIYELSIITCQVAAYPEATISWFYKPCLDWSCSYAYMLSDRVETRGIFQIAYLNITAETTGYIMCSANNSLGTYQVFKEFVVTDVRNGFGIWGSNQDLTKKWDKNNQYQVAVGDNLSIYCRASSYTYTNSLKWYKEVNGQPVLLESYNHYSIERSSTEYSNTVTLNIQNVAYSDAGKYSCVIENKTDINTKINDSIIITITDLNLTNSSTNCQIPNFGLHTRYTILGESRGATYQSGDYAHQFNTLEVSCDRKYKPKPFTDKRTICINGQWNPPLTVNCSRTCPTLTSTISTTVRCKYHDIPLENCNNPIEETTALLSCNSLYEHDGQHNNRIRLCRAGRWIPGISECYPKCGIKRPKGRTNIVNGQNAILGDFPWQIGIYNARKEFICGGSILDRHIILTAAHCVADNDGNVKPIENYNIAAGKYYRKYDDDKDEYAQYSKVLRIYVPDRYTGITNNFALDIAILILTDPFTISVSVQPLCIELNEESPYLDLSLNRNGIVTGWGYTAEGRDLSEVLKELVIPYVPFRKCFDEVPDIFRRFITIDKICGGYLNNNTSICEGDSGGALVFKNILSDRYYVKGIVSTSPATAEFTCDSNQYSLYTSVSHHVNFIRNILAYNEMPHSIEFTAEDATNEETD